jgi:hypothetical protein
MRLLDYVINLIWLLLHFELSLISAIIIINIISEYENHTKQNITIVIHHLHFISLEFDNYKNKDWRWHNHL